MIYLVSVTKFLNFSLENRATGMSQTVRLLQMYLKVMSISTCHATDKRLLWKRKNDRRLERAPEKERACFFPNTKQL